MPPINHRRWFEIIAVAITGLDKFVFTDWLGAFFYYILMERDPYLEVFGKTGL